MTPTDEQRSLFIENNIQFDKVYLLDWILALMPTEDLVDLIETIKEEWKNK